MRKVLLAALLWVLMVAACALVSIGVFLIATPAGFIAAGLLLAALCYALAYEAKP